MEEERDEGQSSEMRIISRSNQLRYPSGGTTVGDLYIDIVKTSIGQNK